MTHRLITLVVTGGIAAYKTPELIRQLHQRGIACQVVMTQAAREFVTPLTLETVSGRPVIDETTSGIAHIDATRESFLTVVCPATANTIAKMANGIADNFASSLLLAARSPVAVVPAMNEKMYAHPATQRNLETLKLDGTRIWGPAQGFQACGDTGMGRMIDVHDIADLIDGFNPTQPFKGKRVVITAGPTVEYIDSVRAITNLSSGQQGYSLAKACRDAGAAVTLVAGPTALPDPWGVEVVHVKSAQQMDEAVKAATTTQVDLFIGVAAVADFRLQSVDYKIKKGHGSLPTTWLENPDIIHRVAQQKRARTVVGFAAETDEAELEHYARTKLERKGLDAIVANLFNHAHGKTSNTVKLITATRAVEINGTKNEVARQILANLNLNEGQP